MDKKIVFISQIPLCGREKVIEELLQDKKFKAVPVYCIDTNETGKRGQYIFLSTVEFLLMTKKNSSIVRYGNRNILHAVNINDIKKIIDGGNIPVIPTDSREEFNDLVKIIRPLINSAVYEMKPLHILLWNKKIISDKSHDAVNDAIAENKAMFENSEFIYSYITENTNPQYTCNRIKKFISKKSDDDCGYIDFIGQLFTSDNLNTEGKFTVKNSVKISCSQHMTDYTIKNRCFQRDVDIENIIIDNDQQALIFENCTFENIKLSSIKCREIRFIGCTINSELTMYNVKADKIIIRGCPHISSIIFECMNNKNTVLNDTLPNIV